MKKTVTVAEATLKSFKKMPKEFHPLTLVAEVRKATNRPKLMDGTILRELRRQREAKTLNYDIRFDNHFYTKKK